MILDPYQLILNGVFAVLVVIFAFLGLRAERPRKKGGPGAR